MLRKVLLFLCLISFSINISLFGSQKVYIIHGYGSSAVFMGKINRALRSEGFKTVKFRYRSVHDDLNMLGLQLFNIIKESNDDTISFVTHSMGALVLRSMYQYLDTSCTIPTIFRIVMLAPPNKGAEIADQFSSGKLSSLIFGPNLAYMKTDSDSYANKLPLPISCEVGVIIGVRGKKKGYNPFIKGDNDGDLSPQREILGIEKDIVFVKSSHAAMTHSKKVISFIQNFLMDGTFHSMNFQLN